MGFRSYDMKEFELSETCKWSGKESVPSIGQRVKVTMNGLGTGIVEAYFIEDVWLGVYVKLDNPPAWWTKQQGTHGGGFGRRAGCCMVFGTEIKSLGQES